MTVTQKQLKEICERFNKHAEDCKECVNFTTHYFPLSISWAEVRIYSQEGEKPPHICPDGKSILLDIFNL